jgi:hypothetical protein
LLEILMNDLKTKWWWFVLVPGLAMWLGWGVRGVFGHANGAMLPGALVALALSFLLKGKRFSLPLAVAMTAVGFGFGADETTLQSAGYVGGGNVDHLVKLGVAYPGLAIKGALWAMFGGAGLGLALTAHLHRLRNLVIGVLLLIASFYLGWRLINKPKLIYFSYDRREIWAGLLFGGIAFLAWMTVQGGTRIPLKLAGWAALGGGVGYPIAVTLSVVGRHAMHGGGYDWWKLTETTFGTFMGASIGIGTYLLRDQLPSLDETPEPKPATASHSWAMVLGGALGAVVANSLYAGFTIGGTSRAFHDHLQWIFLGPILWCVAYYSPKAAWHIGVTMTFYASANDLILFWRHDEALGHAAVLWAVLGLATLVVSWKVAGWSTESGGAVARKAFSFLIWAALVLSWLLLFVNRAVLNATAEAVAAAGGRWAYLVHAWGGGKLVGEGFLVAALVLTWMIYRISHLQETS